MRFNLEILSSYDPKKDREESDFDFTDPNEIEINQVNEALKIVLSMVKVESFKTWLGSNYNLDRFGYTLPFNPQKNRTSPILFWEELCKLYNRLEYLACRLEMTERGEDAVDFKNVKGDLHFERLRKGFSQALKFLGNWKASNPVKRAFANLLKKPLKIRDSKEEVNQQALPKK